MSTVLVDSLMSLMAATNERKHAAVTDGVLQAIGQQPASFDDWARRHAAAFV